MINNNENLVCYKRLGIWDAHTLPEGLKKRHNTKEGTWGQLTVLSGYLVMEFMSDTGNVTETTKYSPEYQPPFIEPQQYHRIASWSDDMTRQLAFYHKKLKDNI